MKKWPFFLFTAVWMCLTVRPVLAQQGTTVQQSVQPAVAAATPVNSASSGILFPGRLMTGKGKYTVANTHSHNDYEQSVPFWMAWQAKFGSIEADIWLQDGRLLVGHNREEIKAGRTLEEYYVKPLLSCVEKNNGHPYSDTTRCLQILIDVKADSVAALNALVTLLNKYPVLEQCAFVKWVISGNRPAPDLYTSYPSFIAFDGILGRSYTPGALSRIVMMSDDLRSFTRWNGQTELPEPDKKNIEAAITHAHEQHLPVRFWDAPDTPAAWDQLMKLHTDYINTDHIQALANYLSAQE
ncbi:MAG TPA: phosphatidylinositol-specific phospholipase C/glycerophosphodiester phosphodiesterase family protein [Puia sp.]|nr:phosphatidylinositol-specific phospholipase C/glycerophosphodiester phosphodiesterase family protein [Puia sp.]